MTQLIILPNGRAKEIHPMGAYPKRSDYPRMDIDAFEDIEGEWLTAESSLKEYRIINIQKENGKIYEAHSDDVPNKEVYLLKTGQVVTCEVNQEEGTCIII